MGLASSDPRLYGQLYRRDPALIPYFKAAWWSDADLAVATAMRREGASYPAIAARLGRSPKAVKRRLQRAA